MIVNSQGAQTPYSELGEIHPMFTGIKFPGGTQAMKTYPMLQDVPEVLLELKETDGGNPYFIQSAEKTQEVQDFAELNSLDIYYGVNSQMTIDSQIASIQFQLGLAENTKYLLLGSENYLRKWVKGEPNNKGVSRQVLLADYLLYLEKIIPILREKYPEQNIVLPGASWIANDNGQPINQENKRRRDWNRVIKFWIELAGYTGADWLHTDFHIYIGRSIDQDFDEEQVFNEVQTHWMNDIQNPLVTEMGTYLEQPHPQNIELYDKIYEALDQDMGRFGIHVLYIGVVEGYSKEFDRFFTRHWFALYDPLGMTPKLDELIDWHNSKVNVVVDPELTFYTIDERLALVRGKERKVLDIFFYWSDGTRSFTSGIKGFIPKNMMPSDATIGQPKNEFQWKG